MRQATWNVAGGGVLGPAPFFVAGIINVTPDSFYDGGRHADAPSAVAHGRRLLKEGADILDVGGESTRPGSEPVSMEVELDRVLPVIRSLAEAIAAEASGAVISVDTYKAAVAGHALKVGACIVNDVSACRFDPALLDVLVEEKPGYVLMHCPKRPKEMQKSPEYGNVVDDILFFFEERLKVLTDAGLPEENIVLDPGIGFGKTLEHNLAIMVGIERFAVLGRPLYIGLSNKSLWGKLLGSEPEDRLAATVAATAIMAARGVAVHRVHEVHETVQVLGVVKALATAGAE